MRVASSPKQSACCCEGFCCGVGAGENCREGCCRIAGIGGAGGGAGTVAYMGMKSRKPPISSCSALETLLIATAKKWKLRTLSFAVDAPLNPSEFSIEVDNRTIEAQATSLITLMRDIWGVDCLPKNQWLCVLPSQEVFEFARTLLPFDRAISKILYIQNQGPYDAHLEQEVWLKELFPRPIKLSLRLDVAASSGALLRRAIPYLTQGNTLDRVIALSILLGEVGDGLWDDRNPKQLMTMLNAASRQLQEARNSPAIIEGGWLLSRELGRLTDIYNSVR